MKNSNETKNITVGMLIKSLQEFDENDPVEVAVTQYNKYNPVAYCKIEKSVFSSTELYCTKRNGRDVRIEIQLPVNEDSMMVTMVRKIN